MTESEIAYKLETGLNAKQTKTIRELHEDIEIEIYSEKYVKWIEQRSDINIQALKFMQSFDKLGMETAIYRPLHELCSKILKNYKSI